MTYNFLIAPDFAPERLIGWHMLNTRVQKKAETHIHLLTPTSHTEQTEYITDNAVDIIYANPFDAAAMIREHGFKAIARPINRSDEMVIVAKQDDATANDLTLLSEGDTVAMADNRDVKLIGLRLLEAVDLTEEQLKWDMTETFQAAARSVIQGNANAGFFLRDVYQGLSKLTKSQLKVLIESDISVISHVVLVKTEIEDYDKILQQLLSLKDDADGQTILAELGLDDGFETMEEEEAEFMIDLMETLLD